MAYLLVVDDDPEVGQVVKDMLEDRGFRAARVANGREMRRMLGEQAIDLVVLDAILPGEDCQTLAGDARDRGIPVVLMTGNIDRQQSVADCGLPYLLKPFRQADLVRVIAATLATVS